MPQAFIKGEILITFLLVFPIAVLQSQETVVIMDILEFQKELNAGFADEETSPLTEEGRKSFLGLDFYPIDTTYRVVAQFVRTPFETPFEMPTTTDRKPIYVKFGEAHFNLKGREFRLDLFQNLALTADPEYIDYLFVPFNDPTNGLATYGGGRYLDLRIPKSDTLILDFNRAYNPYCAYNGSYSCPIPPEQNNLDIAIEAGVKAYKGL